MKVVGLVSGGKDSCYNMMQCVSAGHSIVALANLHPPHTSNDEMDSYMYQTVGHGSISLYAEAMGLPLYRAAIKGDVRANNMEYSPTDGDEVEDLFRLLTTIKGEVEYEAVSVGAILSDYQRLRVENVCGRLGVTPLALLWRRDQAELLQEMVSCRLDAVVIKVAALGLMPDQHLGQTLQQIQPHLKRMADKYGLNVCGEGGEYETFTLDCPLFKKKIVVDEQDIVMHSDDAFAPVAYLNFTRCHLEDKQLGDLSQAQRIRGLPLPLGCPSLVAADAAAADGSTGVPPDGSTVCVPEAAWLSPCVAEKDGWVWICQIDGRATDTKSAMDVAWDKLDATLASCDLTPADLTSVCLYVGRLSQYAQLNAAYERRLAGSRPARVCVQCPLPGPAGRLVRLECVAVRPGAAQRRFMHVQSVSHWAPANIGPYSQTVQCGDILHVAGMIGLDAASMRLVRGGENQARLALRHVRRCIEASSAGADTSWVAQTVCFVTDPALVAPCSALLASSLTSSLSCTVVVPALPRGADVEWHVWGHAHNQHFTSQQSCLQLDGASLDVSLRWSSARLVAVATVLCTCPETPSAGQLAACLRATVSCLRARAGGRAICQLRVFHRVRDTAAVSDAARAVRGSSCVATTVPVLAVGSGSQHLAVVGLALGGGRQKRD